MDPLQSFSLCIGEPLSHSCRSRSVSSACLPGLGRAFRAVSARHHRSDGPLLAVPVVGRWSFPLDLLGLALLLARYDGPSRLFLSSVRQGRADLARPSLPLLFLRRRIPLHAVLLAQSFHLTRGFGFRPSRSGLLSWGFQRPPLHRHADLASTPGCLFRRTDRRWLAVTKLRACSVLAVLPGFDGLLRPVRHRFVAPCCRPWGSPRLRGGFSPTAPTPIPSTPKGLGLASLTDSLPSEDVSGRARWRLRRIARSGALAPDQLSQSLSSPCHWPHT